MLRTNPSVFAVGDTYQIMVPVKAECMMYVRVGDKTYYDESNGILRSGSMIHKVTVPMAELDCVGEYTVGTVEVIERKPYFTKTGASEEKTFSFRPVRSGKVRTFEIADTHADIVRPVQAARHYGEIDFLILNGDINNDSGSEENFVTAYEIASEITGGEIPVVSVRGNHDMRGMFAVECERYIPTDNGNTYFTFRLGNIWGLALDCGEDKNDDHREYGSTICCHAFRQRQIEFMRDIIARSADEYAADGVEHKIVINHIPFTQPEHGDFDIEHEIYTEWSRLIREEINADVMISGHVHNQFIMEPGTMPSFTEHPCTVVVGSKLGDTYGGAGFEFGDGRIDVTFVDNEGHISLKHTINK